MTRATASIRPFSLDLERPLSRPPAGVTEREGWLVSVQYDAVAGIGEAATLPGQTGSGDRCQAALDTALVEVWSAHVPGSPDHGVEGVCD